MKEALSVTQITSRINRPDDSIDPGKDVISGFDKEALIDFLQDQYLDNTDIESEGLTLEKLKKAKTALYHDIVGYKDTLGNAQSAIKWTSYGSSTLMALLAALNLQTDTNNNSGKITGSHIYSITQLVVAVVAVGIVKTVCEPIIETRNEVIARLKVVYQCIDAEITKRKVTPTLFQPTPTSNSVSPTTVGDTDSSIKNIPVRSVQN